MKTKKTVLIFLLIIAAVFRTFAQTGGDDTGKGGQTDSTFDERIDLQRTVPPSSQDFDSSIEARLRNMQNSIDGLKYEIENLRTEINVLKSESRGNSGTWDNSFPGPAPQTEPYYPRADNPATNPAEVPGSGSVPAGKLRPVLGVMIFVLAALLIICIVSLVWIKSRSAGKESREPSGEKSARFAREGRQDANPYRDRQFGASKPASSPSSPGTGYRPSPSLLRESGNAEASPGFSGQRPAAPKPPPDEISPLFRSAERREKRHGSDPGDIFLDLEKSVLERLVQGEKIQPVLERRGTRLSAQFVLIDNKRLYPNFYIYNETRELSNENGNDKVLSMMYDLIGEGLPGFVEKCRPAVVSPRGDTFTIAGRGAVRTGTLGVI